MKKPFKRGAELSVVLVLMIFSIFVQRTASAEPAAPGGASGSPESQRLANARHPSMKLHVGDGDLQRGEYEIIDMSGGVTRSPCPYTCQDRGLSSKNCRAWQSQLDRRMCYVQDSRIPSQAIPRMTVGGASAPHS